MPKRKRQTHAQIISSMYYQTKIYYFKQYNFKMSDCGILRNNKSSYVDLQDCPELVPGRKNWPLGSLNVDPKELICFRYCGPDCEPIKIHYL